jgi:hypothetical protein
MSHITTLQLAEMAGITKRHCQRLLVAGDVPDAVRTSGGHWSIPDNAKVRKWCKTMRAEKHQRPAVKLPAKRKAIERRPAVPIGNELPECLENLDKARKEMQHAIELARQNAERAGALLIAAYNLNPGGKWRHWLAENGYDADMLDLMNFARWCEKEGHDYLDSTILRKFGLIEKKPRSGNNAMPRGGWVGLSGKLSGKLHEIEKLTPIDGMDEWSRLAIAQQLKPIAEIYAKLSR